MMMKRKKLKIDKNKVVRLLRAPSMRKALFRLLFGRTLWILLFFLVQAGILFSIFRWFSTLSPHAIAINEILLVIMVLYVVNSRMNDAEKVSWLALLSLLPLVGAFLLWFTRTDLGHRIMKKNLTEKQRKNRDRIKQNPETMKALSNEDPDSAMLAAYVRSTGCYPVYDHADVTYSPSGEEGYAGMLEGMEKAEKFIFLEFFIVKEGVMWGQMLKILIEKARQGVEIRMLYDGSNELTGLPFGYKKLLRELGIQTRVFAPVKPLLSTQYNYRDHRKILVVDGKVAYTGGINLADEYINEEKRFGHWKDAGFTIRGEAVKSYTQMFLEAWHSGTDDYEENDTRYLDGPVEIDAKKPGFILPFGDSPIDDERVGELVFLDVINHARRYVHIMTPYLLLDGEMETALSFAAKRGVDVKIIIPGIPDKKTVYAMAKNNCRSLISAGVEIYEYAPGFIHSKMCVCDDEKAIVGTINLDYRSFYHNFECASYIVGADCIPSMERDFKKTVKVCRPVTEESIGNEKPIYKLCGWLMKGLETLL